MKSGEGLLTLSVIYRNPMKGYLMVLYRLVWLLFLILFNPGFVVVAAQESGENLSGVKVSGADEGGSKNGEFLSLDFKNVDIAVFTRFVSEATGKNFVIGEKVRGKVTVFSPSKISKERLYEFFLSTLDSRGLTVIESAMGKDLYEILPVTDIKPMRKIHIYKLLNSNAEELVKPLTALMARAGAKKRVTRWPESEFEGKLSLIADKITNSLFVTATDKDYAILKEIISTLDVANKQVFVEVVIMEVASDRVKEIGMELRAANAFANLDKNDLMAVGGTNFGGIGPASSIEGINSTTGLAAGLIQGTFQFGGNTFLNVGALLRMLQSETETNILSTPQILATDKSTAKIIVGENIPFIKGQSQTVGGNVQTNIERQDVGITLEFTPRILGNDKVQLKIVQKIDAVTSSTSSVESGGISLGPTTRKRQINTTIVANNLQTVVLGGLIVDNTNNTVQKVPFLGDIPFLGWLFRFNSSSVTRSNLLVFLTPFIINSPEDLDMILDLRGRELASLSKRKGPDYSSMLYEFIRREAINAPR